MALSASDEVRQIWSIPMVSSGIPIYGCIYDYIAGRSVEIRKAPEAGQTG